MTDRPSRPSAAAPAAAAPGCRAAPWLVGAAAAALLSLAGCQEERVGHYKVAKPYRMLGAVVPHGNAFWFFKVSGTGEEIESHVAEVAAFLDSLKFEGDKPVWKLPQGWHDQPGDAMRYSTLLLGRSDNAPELTVTKLDRQGGGEVEPGVLQNVNRWRTQMGLGSIEADQLAETAPRREVHGVTSYRVDMTGPKSGKTAKGPMMDGKLPPRLPAGPPRAPEGDAKEEMPHYTLPSGWEPAPPDSFSLRAFTVTGGGQQARVTITAFGGDAGGLAANVNRWRGQIGLPSVSETEAERQVWPLDVAGTRAVSFDAAGQGSGAPRTLAVMLSHGGRTWFFKMNGPADLVGRQKDAFESFVKSVRFD
jgi:hypothetical protein